MGLPLSEDFIRSLWQNSFMTHEHQTRFPYRDLMTQSYMLCLDESTLDPTLEVDGEILRQRVTDTHDLFDSCVSMLRTAHIFAANTFNITPEAFPIVSQLVEERYAPHDIVTDNYTTHKLMNMLYSPGSSHYGRVLAKIIAELLGEITNLQSEKVDEAIFKLKCTTSRSQWVTWIEVQTHAGQIVSHDSISRASRILMQSAMGSPKQRQQYEGHSLHYLLCGPSFGKKVSLEVSELPSLCLVWSLSVVGIIHALEQIKSEEYPASNLQMCWPHFFEDQKEGEANFSFRSTIAIDNLRACLS